MAIASNADIYAASRQNIWFTANNQTSADGNLTGQCVTLDKWFMAEMTSVPAPFSARGNANTMGRTLVAQGHAYEVPFSDRRRGDIICYEYGTYGHTAIQLSGGRVFESNVNWSGVSTKLDSTGERVYASRIGSENEAWRVGKNPHVYRLKSYSEAGAGGGEIPMVNDADNEFARWNRLFVQIRGRNASREEFRAAAVGRNWLTAMEILSDNPESDTATLWQTVGQTAVNDKWDQQIYALQDQVKALGSRPTKEQLDAVQKQAADLTKQLADAKAAGEAAQKKAAELELEHIEAQKTGNSFLLWLGGILSKLTPGGK